MPEAEAELAQAWQWHEDRELGLGDELVRAVKVVIAQASREPECYPQVLEDLRRGPVRKFPYGVIYGVRGNHLVVFAVYHSRRDPEGWHGRAS